MKRAFSIMLVAVLVIMALPLTAFGGAGEMNGNEDTYADIDRMEVTFNKGDLIAGMLPWASAEINTSDKVLDVSSEDIDAILEALTEAVAENKAGITEAVRALSQAIKSDAPSGDVAAIAKALTETVAENKARIIEAVRALSKAIKSGAPSGDGVLFDLVRDVAVE